MFGRLRVKRENKKQEGVGKGHDSRNNGVFSYQHGIIMRLRRFFGAVTGRVEGNVASRRARWLYGLACGRRRTDWYPALVFLVPCSVCFTVFMWLYILPSDLTRGCTSRHHLGEHTIAMTETYVAPIVSNGTKRTGGQMPGAGAGVHPRRIWGGSYASRPSLRPDRPASRVKTLCCDEHLPAASGRRRELLQFEGLVDFVADNGAEAFPKDAADVDDALSEVASPCGGCKKLATQVFKEAENGAPDKRWIEAMIRVHGKEWCIRQSASVLPEYDPWKTYRGITS